MAPARYDSFAGGATAPSGTNVGIDQPSSQNAATPTAAPRSMSGHAPAPRLRRSRSLLGARTAQERRTVSAYMGMSPNQSTRLWNRDWNNAQAATTPTAAIGAMADDVASSPSRSRKVGTAAQAPEPFRGNGGGSRFGSGGGVMGPFFSTGVSATTATGNSCRIGTPIRLTDSTARIISSMSANRFSGFLFRAFSMMVR